MSKIKPRSILFDKNEALLKAAYEGFNKRDIDAVLKLMTPDVHWPNGWEGGYVSGQAAVREYWTRQWKEIDPTVTLVSIKPIQNGRYEVLVHQHIKDMKGKVLTDGEVKHIYTIENGLISRMEIEKEA